MVPSIEVARKWRRPIGGRSPGMILLLSVGARDLGTQHSAVEDAGTLRAAGGQTAAVPLDRQSAAIDALLKGDVVYRWWLRFIKNAIPDVGQFYPKDYVANGFDITWGTLLLLNNILPAVAYLLPWALLAYYLMKSREIANP